MIIVGLTGGIGSGKSTVGRMFADLGVPVYDSDSAAKKLMESSSKIKNEIKELLGDAAYSGKKLNKKYISKRVFNDPDALKRLNSIVHPVVKKDFLSWATQQEAPYVIQEAAIIFENGSYKNYDKVILVKAPKKVRVRRIMERDGSSQKEILARMQNQWKDAEKVKLSHFVINNTDLEKTRIEVDRIHRQLVKIAGASNF